MPRVEIGCLAAAQSEERKNQRSPSRAGGGTGIRLRRRRGFSGDFKGGHSHDPIESCAKRPTAIRGGFEMMLLAAWRHEAEAS